MPDPVHSTSSPSTPIAGCLLRLFWMFFGNVAQMFCLLLISTHRTAFPSALDFVYGGIAVCLPAARWLDMRHYGGKTATGEPATTAHLRRYVLLSLAVSLAGWLLVRGWVAYAK